MTMRALVLTSYSLRRIARHRALVTLLFAFPLVCAVAAVLAGARFASYCSWAGPIAFAFLTGGVVLWQKCSDETSGLNAAIKRSPMSARGLTASRLLTAAIILLIQVLTLFIILAIRF